MVENAIYPAYLDADGSRSDGRRVPGDLAVEDPTVEEIAKAVQQVGYDARIEREVSYSREIETRGRVMVEDAVRPRATSFRRRPRTSECYGGNRGWQSRALERWSESPRGWLFSEPTNGAESISGSASSTIR